MGSSDNYEIDNLKKQVAYLDSSIGFSTDLMWNLRGQDLYDESREVRSQIKKYVKEKRVKERMIQEAREWEEEECIQLPDNVIPFPKR